MGRDEELPPAARRVAISAHRGGSEDAPEATYEAYKRSVDSGAEYVEFDIRRTKDGEFVVYHDEHANDTGPALAAISYQQLCDQAGYQVPKVGDVMELIAGKVIGHLDLKEIGYEDEVISLALDIIGADNFVVSTLEDVSIARIKKNFPQVRTGLTLGRNLAATSLGEKFRIRRSELFPLQRIRDCGADWVVVHHKLALTVLRLCARHGIDTMVWTVNDENLIKKFLVNPHVTVLITDRPQHAVGMRAALSNQHP